MKIIKLSLLTLFPTMLIILFYFMSNVGSYMMTAYLGNQFISFIIWPPLLIGSVVYALIISKTIYLKIATILYLILVYLILILFQSFHLYFRYDVRVIPVVILLVLWGLLFSINIFTCIKNKNN